MKPQGIEFAAMPQTAVNIIVRPADFFQKMSRTGGFLEPLVFAMVMGFVAGVVQAVLYSFGYGTFPAGETVSGSTVIIYMPIAAAIGSFVGAAILFVIWKVMGSPHNYETAYRCGAYLIALSPIIAVVGVVPYAGGLVNMAIYVYYIVTASIYVHDIPPRKAWLVFGIIAVIFALLGLFAEHKTRSMASFREEWRKLEESMGKEYQQSSRDMKKSTQETRRQAGKKAG